MKTLSERGEKAAKVVKVLTDARTFLSKPEHWITGRMHSQRASPGGKKVETSCSLGALERVAVPMNDRGLWNLWPPEAKEASVALASAIIKGKEIRQENAAGTIVQFNDTKGHEDVLSAFDRAIEAQCKIVRQEAAQNALASDIIQSVRGPEYDSSAWTGLDV